MARQHSQKDNEFVLSESVKVMERCLKLLRSAGDKDFPEEIQDKMIGTATREAVRQMEVLRDQYGFDQLLPEE